MSRISFLATLDFIAHHPLSSKRPLGAFARYARWQIISRILSEVEFNWIEGSKLIVRNGMTGATGNIYCGLHEFVEMAFLLHLLRPEDLFVDIGANVGTYTVLASAVCGARTLSIEPDPQSVRFLRRNVESNKIENLVTIVEAAVGANPGKARFTVGQDTTNHVTSKEGVDTRVVQITTLDECLERTNPVFIKMDVEGSEAKVVAGADASLCKPSLLALQVETADEYIETRLAGLGFRRSSYNPFTRHLRIASDGAPKIASQNTLYVRDFVGCQERVKAARSRNIAGLQI